MNNEFYVFVSFILIGIIVSLLFDIFRILRKVYRTSDLITIAQDIAFWCISGIIILLGIFILNEGKIRIYLFIGLFIGITFYISIISKIVMKAGIRILEILNKIVFSPIHKLLQNIFSLIFKSTNLLTNKIKKLKIDIFCNKKFKKRRN